MFKKYTIIALGALIITGQANGANEPSLATRLKQLQIQQSELATSIRRTGIMLNVANWATRVLIVAMSGAILYTGHEHYKVIKDIRELRLSIQDNTKNAQDLTKNAQDIIKDAQATCDAIKALKDERDYNRRVANGARLQYLKRCENCDLEGTDMSRLPKGQLKGGDLTGATNAHLAHYRKCSSLPSWMTSERKKDGKSNAEVIKLLTDGYTICE